MLAPLIS
jgi:hypothetical protein